MNTLKIQSLNKELKELETRSGITGSAIVNRNGLLITSRLPRDIDQRKIGAIAATMFGAIETASTALKSNEKVYSLTIELDEYQLIVLNASDDIIFASLIDLNVNLGLILIELEETLKKIRNIVKK
jgi:predicted regulator of Ras-like GTPase activity (Roadblock/LC7/MglB family)